MDELVYPSGNTYTYYNDGLGRASCIGHDGGGYVRDIAWHPNGKIASLTRGNNEPYAQGLNARQLVDSIASYGETLNYFYDGNGRVTDIVAQFDDAYDRVFGYDGAGRLDSAYGPWGTGSYTYDPLGNIKQKKLGSRTVDIEYDALNHVDRVRDSASGGNGRPAFSWQVPIARLRTGSETAFSRKASYRLR
ncbi:hypothetical protein F3N42_15455 [Marinihelvus fidelis]|uniref:RHS repeat protein n=1 Tax=Marinihelvus fidelis TaxID=2613842 RepID=A0A5N0T461_9GAMM|nr:hypothetical protein [Marinihelvus fidelis]KAA9129588.1 hypothetical protein F3N42_15455 [Marinihelvus fidelis]